MANDNKAMSGGAGKWHRSRWEDYINARNTVHEEWFNNSSALYGDPFTIWDDTMKQYLDALHHYRNDRVLFNINKLRPILAARDSFITGENATVYVHSNTDETIGRQRASLAQRVARAYWQEHDMWSSFLDAREYCKWAGNGYTRIYFNPWLGKKVKGSTMGVGEGKVMRQVLSPFQVAWDPLADEWDKINHLYIASIIPVEEAVVKYPGLNLTEAQKDSERSAWVSQHERYIQAQKPEFDRAKTVLDAKGRKRNILRLEYFEKPSKEHPNGVYAVIIGDQWVKELPLEVNAIPVVPFFDMKKAGTLIAQTPLTEMVPLQEAIDRMASLLLERAQIPDFIGVPQGWPTDVRKFAGKAFVIAELSGYGSQSVGPMVAQSGQIRQDFIMLFRLYEEQMENIAGVSSIASRQKPGYQMSGRMGYIVTDANRAMLSKISYGFKKSCEQTMRLVLMYINRYYTEERTANFINESDLREVVRYRGTDIGTDYTLDVSLGPNIMDDPTTIALNTLQFLSLPIIQQQVAMNPVALKKATECVNPELAEKMFGAEQDTGVAEDENFEIRQGGTPHAMPWQNDDVHLREHTRQRNSDETLEWVPSAVKYLEIHMQEHEQQKMSKMARQAMMMNMFTMGNQMQGGAGGGQRRATGGSPGITRPQTPNQSIDTALERSTVAEFPEAPKPGG
jgi:hypothetical protein